MHNILCMTDLLTTGQVAQLANVHPSTVHRWAASGGLRVAMDANGIRLFDRTEVEAFLEQRTVKS